MPAVYRNENHFANAVQKKARRAVVAGRAQWLHERPVAIEVRQPSRPPVKHQRGRFGEGLIRSLPNYLLPVSLEDISWWAEESRREEDKFIDRLGREYEAQCRLEQGLDC